MDIIKNKEVYKMFFKVMKALNEQQEKYKMIYIGNAKWTNARTDIEEKINGLYALGFESSCRPRLINSIELKTNQNTNIYSAFNRLNHTNICADIEDIEFYLVIDNKAYQVRICYQEFCNPITAYDVWNTPTKEKEKEIVGLLKANLLTQNFDDSFSSISSVKNTEEDILIDNMMTRFDSPIELLLGKRIYKLNDEEKTEKLIRINGIKDEQIWAKYKQNNQYCIVSKKVYRENKEQFSDYFPTFDKKTIEKMNIEIPKQKFDLGVYGLGSAGTAILDQICRSNWINSIYLCDFDTVEAKNINNQWYTNEDIEDSKTFASANKIKKFTRSINNNYIDFNINSDKCKFEETDYAHKQFTYVISGFDSIKIRQNFFKEIKSGNLETKYLIDCRYLDLASSVYIIDTSNKEQMDFYETNLNADAELLEKENKKETMTKDEFIKWLEEKEVFTKDCGEFRSKYFKDVHIDCSSCSCHTHDCADIYYEKYLEKCLNGTFNKEETNTCIKFNYIDIYKYVGAIVFGAIRKLQNGLQKPFTYLEAQTDVKGLPNYMVIKE